MGIKTGLYPCVCWFCNWSWSCLEVPLHDFWQRWGRLFASLSHLDDFNWFPISSCHLVPSACLFLQAIFSRRNWLWKNCILMKHHGNKVFSKSGFSFFVTSSQLSSSWSLSPNLCKYKKGLEYISQVFFVYGWLTINSKSCPSIVQASTSLGKIKWLPF